LKGSFGINIFKNGDGLLVQPSTECLEDSMKRFWKLAKEIQIELGDKGYYLTEYLSNIFGAISSLDIIGVTSKSDKYCWDIFGCCLNVCECKDKKSESEFAEIVENYKNKNAVNFKHNHTKVEFYAANILLENLHLFLDHFTENLRKKLFSIIDFPAIDGKYNQISELIGEQKIEYLNDLIYESFVVSPVAVVAANQVMLRAVEMLTYRDPETSKQIFELIMQRENND